MRLYRHLAGFAVLVAGSTVMASPSEASPVLRDCKITELVVTQTRMEIQCDSVPERPNWNSHRRHAAPLSDGPAKIEAMMSIALEAWRSGRTILVHTDTVEALAPAGCNPNNCRILRGVTLR